MSELCARCGHAVKYHWGDHGPCLVNVNKGGQGKVAGASVCACAAGLPESEHDGSELERLPNP